MDTHALWDRLEAVERQIIDRRVLVGLGELRGHLAGAHRIANATPSWLRWLHRREIAAVHSMIVEHLDDLDLRLRRRG